MVPLAQIDAQGVEALLDRAFGPDRHGRTAYRLREGARFVGGLSLAALDDEGRLAGILQCWPVALRTDDGAEVPMVLVGPVAVEPSLQQGGIGRLLMTEMLVKAAESPLPGHDALMLIGDPEYYGRFFGFTSERTGGWRLPGPFEARRLLARGAAVPDASGMVVPRLEDASPLA